ncbi:MAG TPA: hypothetical protein VMU10_09745 [Desulfomonilia bacterium]|nr:hypothetical protein [Desulfomonilia bacterium]
MKILKHILKRLVQACRSRPVTLSGSGNGLIPGNSLFSPPNGKIHHREHIHYGC